MKRTWVLASFGDIRDFGTWEYRAATPPEVKEPFILRFYETMQAYVRKHTEVHFKYEGDGFLVIREFSAAERSTQAILKHLKDLHSFINQIKKDFNILDYPSLDNFIIRHFSGHVYKLRVLDPNDPKRKRLTNEFVGYVINAAHRLLEVNPDVTCLASEGVIKSLNKHKSFVIKPLGAPSCYPKSMNREDVDKLQIIKW